MGYQMGTTNNQTFGPTIYKVEVKHPTGYHKGIHNLAVRSYPATDYQKAHKTVDGAAFGYSRDYYTDSDLKAITIFLAGHACTVVECRTSTRGKGRKVTK